MVAPPKRATMNKWVLQIGKAFPATDRGDFHDGLSGVSIGRKYSWVTSQQSTEVWDHDDDLV
jgi:hypothetical protein